MSYGYEYAVPAIDAQPSERATFIRRTYLHLAGAILAFAAIEAAIFSFFGLENVVRFVGTSLNSPVSALIVLALFIGSGFLARMWAQSRSSVAMQYAGLGLYVVAEALIFVPILAVCQYQLQYQGLIQTAGLLTLFVFGGLTVTAFTTGKDFSFLRPILVMGGFLALGLIVVSIVFPNFLGLGLWFSFLMVGLVCASILYTTSNILRYYSVDMHVAAALELFAAIATLFYYILRILMQLRDR